MLREGDPVWVDRFSGELIQDGTPTEQQTSYTGPGVAYMDDGAHGVLIQIGQNDMLWVPLRARMCLFAWAHADIPRSVWESLNPEVPPTDAGSAP